MRTFVCLIRPLVIAVVVAGLVLTSTTYSYAQMEADPTVEATQDGSDYEPGPWMFRLRGLGVIPVESSTIGVIGGEVTLGNSFVPELDITYFFHKHVAAELILAVTRHTVGAVGTAVGDLDLGYVWLLPPTLTFQWHFIPDGQFRPYAGAGVNYTVFFGEDPGDADAISYKNRFGFALQGGMDIGFAEKWAVNVDVKKVFLNTDVVVSALDTLVPADVTINPWIFGVGVAFRP